MLLSKRHVIGFILFITLLEIVLYHPYNHDTTGWIYPIRKWFVREVHGGYLPLWMNSTRYGWATTEIQTTAWVWSPVAFAIALFTADYDHAMLNVEFLVWRVIAFSGVYAWISQFCNRYIAVTGALGFIFSYYFIDLEKQITIYIGYALIPWYLWFVHRFTQGRFSGGSLAVLCIVTLTMLWSTYPGVWVVCLVPIAAYGALLLPSPRRWAWHSPTVKKLGIATLAIILGAAPLAVRFFTSGLFGGALRATGWSPDEGALPSASVVRCALGSWSVLAGLEPHYCLGEYSSVGLVALVAVVIIAPRSLSASARHISAIIVCGLITYILSESGAIGSSIRAAIPLYAQMRWYSIHINLIILMILAFYGIHAQSIIDTFCKSTIYHRWGGIIQNSVYQKYIGTAKHIVTDLLLMIFSVLIFHRTIELIGYSTEKYMFADWSYRADERMQALRADYEVAPEKRLMVDIDRRILNLLTDAPHIAFYKGLVPEVEAVDQYWGSPTLFEEFLVFPAEWHRASPKDLTISREAMRGSHVAHRSVDGWASRTCPEASDRSPETRSITKNHSTLIEGTIRTRCSGLAVWMDTYDDGWRVWVNGVRATLFRVNNAVRGFEIGPGDTTFVMEYSSVVSAWRRLGLLFHP